MGVLEREATNRELYQTFLSRFKETNATNYSQVSNARLVDAAVPALLPIRPAKARTVAIAAALSLLIGVIGSLLLKALHNTVKTSGDVEAKLHQPFLVVLPVLPGKAKQNIPAPCWITRIGSLRNGYALLRLRWCFPHSIPRARS